MPAAPTTRTRPRSSSARPRTAGGGYTLHVAGDIDVTGNRFSTMFHDTCGFYGPIYPEALDPGSEWSNNVWHDGPDEGQELEAP